MKHLLLLILSSLTFSYCTPSSQKSKEDQAKNSIKLEQENILSKWEQNDSLHDKFSPIRANFNRINTIKDWSTIKTYELNESTEGGEAKYYYQGNILEKITTHHFGETLQVINEYFLKNGELSFVFEKQYKYNRPLYYDSLAMQENNDNEVFDFKKSKILETRYYFEKGKLFYQIKNERENPDDMEKSLPENEKQLKTSFDKLLAAVNK